MNLSKLKYNIKNRYFNIKAKCILKLIGDIPVIVNCTIYDDIFEYNFGKTMSYSRCIAFNNTIKNFNKYAKRYKSNVTVLNKNEF